MIKDPNPELKNPMLDNMDDIIALLNSKNYDAPNKVKLRPIALPLKKSRHDEVIEIEDMDVATHKASLMTNEQTDPNVKTQEGFFQKHATKNRTLSRIRRNLQDYPVLDTSSGFTKKVTPKIARGGLRKERNHAEMRRKGFNIRKVKKKFKGPLNLITKEPDGPSYGEELPVRRRALDDNRLARSKHVLIKTFNRYLSNPSMFMKNSGGFKDLVHLNSNFDDPHLAANLFRTGTDTYQRTIEERRCLIFRPFLGNINQTVPDPEDYGYNFRTTSGVKIIISTLKDNGFNQTSSSKNWILHWQVGRCKAQLYTGLQSHQKVNRFPMSYEITRKDKMNRNISQMALKFGKSYNFVPKTYLLPQELALLMRDGEKKRYQKKYYICKPNASSQGKGIYVTDDIEMILNKKITDVLVSEYISNPLLINGKKFDLRIYVCITCANPLRFYIYEDGLVRFATENFTLSSENMSNRYVHLTNYSVNKHNHKEGMTVSKYKWSLYALRKTMRNLGLDPDLMMMRIEDVIIKTIISIEDKLYKASEKYVPFRNNCFQLLGFDILIDSKLNPWLIEVNLSPSLGTDSEIDLKIKSQLVANLLTLVGVEPLNNRGSIDESRINKKLFKYLKPFEEVTGRKKKGMSIRKKEMNIIQETREEILRAKKWKLLFPSYNVSLYKQFFEEDKANNAILRNESLSLDRIMKNLGKIRTPQRASQEMKP